MYPKNPKFLYYKDTIFLRVTVNKCVFSVKNKPTDNLFN